MKKKIGQGRIEGVLVLLLFAVFAGSLLLVLLTGAQSYRRVAQRGADSYDRRVCAQYIAAKVRHSDVGGMVFVDRFGGDGGDGDISTLYLRQNIDGEDYDTRIYYYDGAVRELFSLAGEAFSPADGDEVLPAGGLTFSEKDGLLTVEAQAEDGSLSRLILTLRSEKEVAA